MNPKTKLKCRAALQTMGILTVISAVAVTVQILARALTTEELTNLIGVAGIAFLVYCMYELVLVRLEYEQTKIDEIAGKK